MPDKKSSTKRADFGLEECLDVWGGHPFIQGTPEQFIASGLLAPEQIPGEAGCPKHFVYRFVDQEDGAAYTSPCSPARAASGRR